MDTDRILREKNRMTLAVALVLSGMVVTISAFLGRGMLQLQSSLTVDTPNELTVVTLVLEKTPEASVIDVTALPHRKENTFYTFMYTLEGGEIYMARVAMKNSRWQLEGDPERLRGSGDQPAADSVL